MSLFRLLSKFDLRRLCRAVGATALPKMVPPSQEEMGHCDVVEVQEIGGTNVILFTQKAGDSRIATIVVRNHITDDINDGPLQHVVCNGRLLYIPICCVVGRALA